MDIKKAMKDSFIIFDGAMGTMLQRAGLKAGQLPEIYNMLRPQMVTDIHRAYVEAGADVVITNSFGANELKLRGTGYSVEQVVGQAVSLAREAVGSRWVALDIGPIGQLMEPVGTLSFKQAYDIVARQVREGARVGADMVLIETITDIYEAKVAVLAAKENCSLPVLCTLSFGSDGRTMMGTDPLTAVMMLEGLGVDAMGVNCSLGPQELIPIVEEMLRYSNVPVMVQPNAGLPKLVNGETVFELNPEEFARHMVHMAQKGVRLMGGCCGTTPEFIRELKQSLEGLRPVGVVPKRITAVTSSSRVVILGNETRVIGERINPTGKKHLRKALLDNDMDYIITEAIEQKKAGADILDINVGLPEINERDMMTQVVREVQGLVDLPLQIDSSEADVIEAGVRIYNGKPLINSVNGTQSSMEAIFPVAKKYGACVLGLTLDDRGLPADGEERFRIAETIVKRAQDYGIPVENILIDCLVMTASAQQAQVMETLKAMSRVKAELGVKTVLGISNISFGLPSRGIINRTYLAMALAMGLDAPILNPLDKDMMDTVAAYRVLANQDLKAQRYIASFAGKGPNGPSKGPSKVKDNKDNYDLKQSIMDGDKNQAVLQTEKLLETRTAMELVNEYLVPILDMVGQKYEKGETFLPQLIQSAEAAQKAFEVIKSRMEKDAQGHILKGNVVLATVEGDIHDIGKNIVKVLLENYGYRVIDLGKDVPADDVLNAIREHDAKMVGLSALMTTTVKNMEKTIKRIKDEGLPCKVVVGGAVLNQEYARMIGADFYGRDAQEAVKIARLIFGG